MSLAGCSCNNGGAVLELPAPSSSRSGKTPAIKGLVVMEFVKWYEKTRGREAALRAYRSLPVELQVHLDPQRDNFGLLASTWYPVTVATGVLETITLGLDHDERAVLLRDGIHHALGSTLTGVYRVLFQTLVTPERHARYAQKIWNQYYNTGSVTAEMRDECHSEQVVTDWEGHHPLLCELSLSSLTVFHEHMGCKNVLVRRTSCVLDSRMSAARLRRPSSTKIRAVRAGEQAAAPAPAAPGSDPRLAACRFLIQWDPR